LLPSIIFEWLPSESTLLYASWSQGSKAGGYDARSNNPTLPPATLCTGSPFLPGPPFLQGCVPANGVGTFEYDDEKADNAEFGAKLRLGGTFELNAAFYMTDFENLQVSTFDGVLGFNVKNAGQAQIKGLEIDARWQATQNLLLSSSLAYTDFEFKDYTGQCSLPAPVPAAPATLPVNCDYAGKTNEFVAPWVATLGANYSRPIGSSLMMHVGFDAYYTDEYFVAPTLDPNQQQESYVKVNGRAGIGDADGSWDISVIGKNIFDEEVLPYGNDTPLAGRTFRAYSTWRFVEPGSTFALQATYRF
jgi:outer membrane receptor protein involved in Fe transport